MTIHTHTHNFIHLLKRQHNYTQKNESEHLASKKIYDNLEGRGENLRSSYVLSLQCEAGSRRMKAAALLHDIPSVKLIIQRTDGHNRDVSAIDAVIQTANKSQDISTRVLWYTVQKNWLTEEA